MIAGTSARVRHALLAAAVAAGAAVAQPPAELNLFGGEPSARPTEEGPSVLGLLFRALGGSSDSAHGPAPAAADGLPHTIIFQDGRQLHGELVSLSKDEIVWKRADAGGLLHFSRAEIRSITFRGDAGAAPAMVQMESESGAPDSSRPAPATVKLPGGDWLYGGVTSADGTAFTVDLGGASKFTVPRASAEWLYFDANPVPAARLVAGSMSLEGWVRSGPEARLQEKDGWFTVADGDWIGRNISPPERFEIAFDLPADDADRTSLWIQPFGPEPNCYGTGTIELQFAPGEITRCIFINNLNHEKSDVPKDAGPDGRAHFRVFYDGVAGKLLVSRNGRPVGDWKIREDNDAAGKQPRIVGGFGRINGFCIQRSGGPKLGALQIRPWDGAVAKEGDPAPSQDLFNVGKDAPTPGHLDSIGEKELVFSGQKKPRGAGAFVQFPGQPKPLTEADALLLFGVHGELGAAGLEVHDGRAVFRTSFADRVDVPASALDVIAFARAAVQPARAGARVFKNGDELPGSLLSAQNGAPLRWKTPSGQEIEFQPGRVAGVRFAGGEAAAPASAPSLQLRNGDLLHGKLKAFDNKNLSLDHEVLGTLSISRDRLWSLYPNPGAVILDASADPAAWLAAAPVRRALGFIRTQASREPVPGQVYLDGKFLMQPARSDSPMVAPGGVSNIGRSLEGMPDKIEVRFEALDASGNEPNASLRFVSKGAESSNSTLDMEFTYGSLRLYGWVVNNKGNNMGAHNFWKDIPLHERNGRYEPHPRLSVRVFVDNKDGTLDVFVNGEHRVKAGQNAGEKIPGIAGQVTLSGYGSTLPLVISNVWVGPWSGELPRSAGAGSVALANGDVAESPPGELKDGKLTVDLGNGGVEVPLDRVSFVAFGGQPETSVSQGRIWLRSGDSVSVDSFRFAEGALVAHSPVLGDLKVEGAKVREIVFDAAPARFPMVAEARKKTGSEDKEADAPVRPPAPAAMPQ